MSTLESSTKIEQMFPEQAAEINAMRLLEYRIAKAVECFECVHPYMHPTEGYGIMRKDRPDLGGLTGKFETEEICWEHFTPHYSKSLRSIKRAFEKSGFSWKVEYEEFSKQYLCTIYSITNNGRRKSGEAGHCTEAMAMTLALHKHLNNKGYKTRRS